ncbi:MAG: VIT1/CCC1 transporter family protein [Treponema sp.]|jgi:VIT1/CCC1 family predicted Fe2+/Mn2+ transporter|nr:VIT1/CCC1 transporter family protein [Treponema sp.]
MEIIQDEKTLKAVKTVQAREITEYHVYTRLAGICKDPHNADILREIAGAEKKHADFWLKRTETEAKPSFLRIFKTVLIARILGFTFTLKQMEKNEDDAAKNYKSLAVSIPEAKAIAMEEDAHENQLLAMLDEERLRYTGSIVLGLNDALVELTGALAGFTFALGKTSLISLAGLVTGISAACSMGASEYLSRRAEADRRAVKSAIYTGGAYIITVIILIAPYLLAPFFAWANKFTALGCTLILAVFIIFIFNYYLATAKNLDFKRRFAEMALISLAVAAFSFAVGWALKSILGVDA